MNTQMLFNFHKAEMDSAQLQLNYQLALSAGVSLKEVSSANRVLIHLYQSRVDFHRGSMLLLKKLDDSITIK